MPGYNDYSKAKLVAALEEYFPEIDVNEHQTKDKLVASLLEQGLDFATFEETINAAQPEEPELSLEKEDSVDTPDEPEEKKVLMFMTGRWHSYEIRGYRFTPQRPFGLVKVTDEEALVNTGGFRRATERELQEFYS